MSTPISRRDFIRTTSTAASLTALASVYAPGAHAAGAEGEIKVGLVGCGGRGTGAASQALMATDTPVKLWAMADLFPENVARSHDMLAGGGESRYDREAFATLAGKMDVPEERRFHGFDAFQSLTLVPRFMRGVFKDSSHLHACDTVAGPVCDTLAKPTGS